MTISHVTAGKVVRRTKINELISAIGSIELSWVNFNGGDGSIRASGGNIDSVTRESPGQYKINFTTLRASINYAVQGCCSVTSGNDTGYVDLLAFNRSWVRIHCRNDDGGIGDPSIVCLVIMGPDPNNRSTALSAVNLPSSTILDEVEGDALGEGTVKYILDNDGFIRFERESNSDGTIGQWVEDVAEVDSFEVRATFLSGTVPSGSPFGSWLDLASDRFWQLTNDLHMRVASVFRLDIRDKASLQVRATAQIKLSVKPPEEGGDHGD